LRPQYGVSYDSRADTASGCNVRQGAAKNQMSLNQLEQCWVFARVRVLQLQVNEFFSRGVQSHTRRHTLADQPIDWTLTWFSSQRKTE